MQEGEVEISKGKEGRGGVDDEKGLHFVSRG